MASRNTTFSERVMTVEQLLKELKDVPGFFHVILTAPTFNIVDGETLESYNESSCEDVLLINEDNHEVTLFGKINS